MHAASYGSECVQSVIHREGLFCCALGDGSIKIWNGTTLKEERTRIDVGMVRSDRACALAMWNGFLISGHCHGDLRLSNVLTGKSYYVVEKGGAWEMVQALAVCGSLLVSGSSHGSIKVWATEHASWMCERILQGDPHGVLSLAVWQGKVLSGTGDHSIRVWDVGTGTHEATLVGHTGRVCGLLVHGDRLLSASQDGTIREWTAGTWAAMRVVEAHSQTSGQYPRCLAVSGSKLISGSSRSIPGGRTEVRVWDLASLECEHTLPQPVDADVNALLAVGGEVWAGVGSALVVWRRV
jgi:WD40 repeat protein